MNAPEAASGRARAPLSRTRSIVVVGAGQAVESYDFILFGLLAVYIGPLYFQGTGADATAATLNTLIVFGVGFVFRPLGAALFGTLADLIGRRPIMLLSVGTISGASLLIGLLPTAEQIGIWATVIIVVLRILQGLAIGVEVPLNATYNVELGGRDELGRYAGIIAMFVQIGLISGALVAFVTSALLGPEVMHSWGWRIPFLIGGLLGVILMVLRRRLPETLEEPPGGAADAEGGSSVRGVWRHAVSHRRAVVATVLIVGGVQILNYGWNVALPNVAQTTYGMDATAAFAATTLFGLIILVLTPVLGRLADRWNVSTTFVWTRWALVPLAFVLLIYAGQGTVTFFVVMILGALILAPSLAIANVIGASLFPTRSRTSVGGLAYSIGVALFGGTASFVLVWASGNGLVWMFCAYGAIVCAVSVVLYTSTIRTTGLYAGR